MPPIYLAVYFLIFALKSSVSYLRSLKNVFLQTSFLKDMKDSLKILLDMPPFPHICFKHFLLQFPFPTIICDIGIVNKITLLEKLTKYKGSCCHGPFSTSVDLIFPFFQKFVENCFCILGFCNLICSLVHSICRQ